MKMPTRLPSEISLVLTGALLLSAGAIEGAEAEKPSEVEFIKAITVKEKK